MEKYTSKKTCALHIMTLEVLVLIRISKHLYINILTIILFIICTFLHTLDVLCITYFVMLLHELAHMAAAICIGLRVSHISLHPFGVNLKLKNKMVYALSDEIILYISGPLCNAACALCAVFMYRLYPNNNLKFFYISNIMLFIMNMLPSAPLDGGILMKKIIARFLGSSCAEKVSRIVSALCAAPIMVLGIYVLYKSGWNFSILLFASLMIGNIFTQKEKYDTDFVKELMFSSCKKPDKVTHIISSKSSDYKEIAKKFNLSRRNIVYITDEDGSITDILTDKQIIDKLLGR